MAHVVRLFVDHPLGEGEQIVLTPDQAHRLITVMRLGEGALVRVFNARAGEAEEAGGEFEARLIPQGKRAGALHLGKRIAPTRLPPDLWLLFSPIKKERTDFIVEKAAELGVARICPVITEHTNAERVRIDRLQAHARAAIEQCGGTWVPEVAPAQKLSSVLDAWPAERRLMFCDESAPTSAAPTFERGFPWAIVVGPEGGFSPDERARLGALGTTASLGPRVLRADTACVAAITLWQAACGDW